MKIPFPLKSIKTLLGLAALFWLNGHQLMAQCTQCKAAAASTDENGELIFGGGINTGVLYLLLLPVLMPFIVGGLWYWKKRQAQRAQTDL